jgi:hypothetical protein
MSGSDGELAPRREGDRVAEADPQLRSDAHLGDCRVLIAGLQAEQRRDRKRDKQGDQRDDRQPWEPIPRRYGTRSDLRTIPLDQTSS